LIGESHAAFLVQAWCDRINSSSFQTNPVRTKIVDPLARLPLFGTHECSSIVALCEQGVVCTADQSQVLDRGFAASCVRVVVMQLQKATLGAAFCLPSSRTCTALYRAGGPREPLRVGCSESLACVVALACRWHSRSSALRWRPLCRASDRRQRLLCRASLRHRKPRPLGSPSAASLRRESERSGA
jgi:hypothetical protein